MTWTPDGLTVRVEKREAKEDKRADAYVSERRYGMFVRTIPLPPGLDVDRAAARIANGVLTVRFLKGAARPRGLRVPIET